MNPAEQTYVLDNGISRMIADLESYIRPIFVKSQPLIATLAKINFIFIPLIFVLILLYVTVYRKHRLIRKLKDKSTLYCCGIGLLLYCFLMFANIDFGQGLSFSVGKIILPTIAKLYGPLISCIFAIIQFILSAVIKGSGINILLLFVSAITGILYGLCLYKRRTKYTTCLSTKIIINLVCNVFLTLLVTGASNSANIFEQMIPATVSAILLAPIQAIFIYLIFRLIRVIKNRFQF